MARAHYAKNRFLLAHDTTSVAFHSPAQEKMRYHAKRATHPAFRLRKENTPQKDMDDMNREKKPNRGNAVP